MMRTILIFVAFASLAWMAMAQEDCPDLAILTQPQSITACGGEAVTFQVAASGDASLAYQWQRNCMPIVGATDSTLSIDFVAARDFASYSVVVTDSCGSLTSDEVSLHPKGLYFLTDDRETVTVCENASYILESGVTGFDPSYEWRLNCNPIPGATDAELDLATLDLVDGDLVDVVVYNSCVSVTGAVAQILRDFSGFSVDEEPQDREVCIGDATSFEISVSQTNFSVQNVLWFKDDVLISGENDLVLSLSTTGIDDSGRFRARIETGCGVFETQAAQLDLLIDCESVGNDFRSFMRTGTWQSEGSDIDIDTNGNGRIVLREAQAVTGNLDLSGLLLANYEGLQYFENLFELDLSENQLTEVPDLLDLVSLHSLILKQNDLDDTANALFDNLPAQLESVSLQGNQLRSMPSFAQLGNLQTIDLSFNYLSDLGTFLTDSTLGDFADDVIDVRYNFLDCEAISELLDRTTQSGATLLYSPQYNLNLFSQWTDRNVDVRDLIQNLGSELDCTGR